MQLFPILLDILFKVSDKVSCRAAWVLEFVCADNIAVLQPHLDYFIANAKTVHFDSAVRPVAKVCALLVQDYGEGRRIDLQQNHKAQLVETSFDWLMANQKVAIKVHAMEVLFLLGNEPEFKWVHPELIQILERDFNTQSAAYKSRAKRVFKRLGK